MKRLFLQVLFSTALVCLAAALVCLTAACSRSGGGTTDAGHDHEAGLAAGGAAAGHEHAAGGAGTEAVTHQGEAAHELHLEPDQAAAWGIETAPAGLTDVSAVLRLPGVLTVNENRTAEITSCVEGKAARIGTDLGRRVEAGQALLVIDSPAWARDQAALLQAGARAALARLEFERARDLLAEQAIEEREYDRREASWRQALADRGAAASTLRSYGVPAERIAALERRAEESWQTGEVPADLIDSRLPIVSPLAGTVIQRDVILGEHVTPERTLFTVSDLTGLWALLDARESDLVRLEGLTEVAILSTLHPGREFAGRITWISDILDPELRTARLRVEVPNPGGALRPNMYIEAVVRIRRPGVQQLAVPEGAITLLHGEPTVFVQGAREPGEDHLVFTARHLHLGPAIGELRIVEGGLTEGELVVVAGAFTLKAEMTKGTAGHAHVH